MAPHVPGPRSGTRNMEVNIRKMEGAVRGWTDRLWNF